MCFWQRNIKKLFFVPLFGLTFCSNAVGCVTGAEAWSGSSAEGFKISDLDFLSVFVFRFNRFQQLFRGFVFVVAKADLGFLFIAARTLECPAEPTL